MVQIIHDLDLILHHLLPKTQAQTDGQMQKRTNRHRCRQQGHTDTEASEHTHTRACAQTNTRARIHTRTRAHIHRHDERCQLFSAMRQCIFSSRSNISHLGEKYPLCFFSKCGLVAYLYVLKIATEPLSRFLYHVPWLIHYHDSVR